MRGRPRFCPDSLRYWLPCLVGLDRTQVSTRLVIYTGNIWPHVSTVHTRELSRSYLEGFEKMTWLPANCTGNQLRERDDPSDATHCNDAVHKSVCLSFDCLAGVILGRSRQGIL